MADETVTIEKPKKARYPCAVCRRNFAVAPGGKCQPCIKSEKADRALARRDLKISPAVTELILSVFNLDSPDVMRDMIIAAADVSDSALCCQLRETGLFDGCKIDRLRHLMISKLAERLTEVGLPMREVDEVQSEIDRLQLTDEELEKFRAGNTPIAEWPDDGSPLASASTPKDER